MLIGRSLHPSPGEAERKERLLGLIDGFASRRVLVVGDVIADEFIYGEVARVSREAPVLILKYDATEMVAGGAGNAANNVAALGGRALLAGIVGADPEGRRLLSSFRHGVDRSSIVRARHYRTPVKTRILAGGVHSAKQQVVRIDREAGWPLSDAVSGAFARKLSPALDQCDAVLLSDYGSGLVTPALAHVVRRALARRSRRRPVPVLIDSRYRLLHYHGLTTCTPNESEVEQVLGFRIEDDSEALELCDAVLLSDYGSGLVTPALARLVRRALARRSRRRPVPVLIDSRYRLLHYHGLTTCTPNESEVEQVLGFRLEDDAEALERAGRLLLRRTGMRAVLITRGSRGMALFQRKQMTIHIPIFGSDEVADVTGAGDTVIAAFGVALAAGASFYEAARLANYAGGLVVMKRGTATVSATELSDAVTRDHGVAFERDNE